MVPLEKRMDYIERVAQNNKLLTFQHFLQGTRLPESCAENSNDLFWGILNSVQKGDNAEFNRLLGLKARSRPADSFQAPFVNDDFLIFGFLVGATKFNSDTDWLAYIISLRNHDPITITFKNILEGDYFSKSNIPEVVLMYLSLTFSSRTTPQHLANAYESVTRQALTIFGGRNDFLILCALSAYDYIILEKLTIDSTEIDLINDFRKRFRKRITFLAWLIQMAFFSACMYLLTKPPIYTPEVVAFINNYSYISTIMGALGLTILTNQIDWLKTKSKEWMMLLLGYPKKLLEKE